MASFKSILSGVGHVLATVFKIVTPLAVASEPIIALALPGLGALINATINEVVNVEALAAAAGSQTGTGQQKLALVIAAIEKEYAAFAAANHIAYDAGRVEAWVNAIVAAINSVPCPAE